MNRPVSKRVYKSLKLELLSAVVFSLLIGAAAYGIAFLIGNITLEHLIYVSTPKLYFWRLVVPVIFSAVAFSTTFVIFINKKILYIELLKEELDILSGGQLDYPVTISGMDELSELALGIDQMRKSILQHQEIEKQMRTANSELITAMSHDLRTPLTSLLAYLEILERQKYADEGQMRRLIHKSVDQTMRIKHMADKLFEYFMTYATEWEYSEMEAVDVDFLFSQVLEDYVYTLENEGIHIENEIVPTGGRVKVNAELFQRALDNLYSNLLKYADPEKTVRISYKKEADNQVHIVIANGVYSKSENVQSTGLGLNTCKRIVEYHGGTFEATKLANEFQVYMKIPLCEN